MLEFSNFLWLPDLCYHMACITLLLIACFPSQLLCYVLSISQPYNFCSLLIFITEKSCIEHQAEHEDVRTNNPAKQPVLCNEANGQSEKCCSRNGICSHEVLRDGTRGSDSKMVKKVFYKSLLEANWAIMLWSQLGSYLYLILWNVCVSV